MKFSIIIPIYNVEKYLRECLNSVFSQTYTDYEIICVNDGSTDGSLNILNEYSRKKIKTINQENKGLSAARNAGINAAKGDYILFLDSDDWIEKNALQVLSGCINGEDMICFNGRRYFENGNEEEPDKGIDENLITGWEYYNKYALLQRKFHFVCTVLRLYKREFMIQHNLLFEEGIYHEDNLFTPIVCYYAKKVKVIPDTLYNYRIREGSISNKLVYKNITDIIKVANKLAAFFIPKTVIDKSTVYREIAGEYFSIYMSPKVEIYNRNYSKVKSLINWIYFKKVSVYPRHKRIYRLLKFHPIFFRLYIQFEKFWKQ